MKDYLLINFVEKFDLKCYSLWWRTVGFYMLWTNMKFAFCDSSKVGKSKKGKLKVSTSKIEIQLAIL